MDIAWEVADKQFRTETLPRYVAATLAALPNAQELNDHSLGALVSLVYNRGQSFVMAVNREEMAAIHAHMTKKKFKSVPDEIISMKRIWKDRPDMKGLLDRRDLEAALFKLGLGPEQVVADGKAVRSAAHVDPRLILRGLHT